MPTLSVHSLPDDGTISDLIGGQRVVRTTENFVWAGYNDHFTFVEYFKAYLVFDTSDIPTNATIESASVSVYVDNVVFGLPDEIPPIQLLHSPWTLPLDSTDWPDAPPPSGSITGPIITIQPSMIGTTVTYEVTNLDIIVPSGLTFLRLVHAGPHRGNRIKSYVRLGSGDNPDTTKRPTLTVVYTVPQPPPENSQAVLEIEGHFTAVPGVITDIYATVHTAIEGVLTATAQTVQDLVMDIDVFVEGVLDVLFEWTIPPIDYPINAVTEGTFEALPEDVVNPPPDTVYIIVYGNIEGTLEALGYIVPAPSGRLNMIIEGKLDATPSGGGGGGSVILQKIHAFVSTATMRAIVVVQRVFGNPAPANIRMLTQVTGVDVIRSTSGHARFVFTTTTAAERHRTVLIRTTAVTTLNLRTTTFRRK